MPFSASVLELEKQQAGRQECQIGANHTGNLSGPDPSFLTAAKAGRGSAELLGSVPAESLKEERLLKGRNPLVPQSWGVLGFEGFAQSSWAARSTKQRSTQKIWFVKRLSPPSPPKNPSTGRCLQGCRKEKLPLAPSASMQGWSHLQPLIALVPLAPPPHGSRVADPPQESLAELMDPHCHSRPT